MIPNYLMQSSDGDDPLGPPGDGESLQVFDTVQYNQVSSPNSPCFRVQYGTVLFVLIPVHGMQYSIIRYVLIILHDSQYNAICSSPKSMLYITKQSAMYSYRYML